MPRYTLEQRVQWKKIVSDNFHSIYRRREQGVTLTQMASEYQIPYQNFIMYLDTLISVHIDNLRERKSGPLVPIPDVTPLVEL